MRTRKPPRRGRKIGPARKPARRVARLGRGRTPDLLALRRKHGLTVTQVARRAHLDPATVWRIENGLYTPPPDTLRRVRRAITG